MTRYFERGNNFRAIRSHVILRCICVIAVVCGMILQSCDQAFGPPVKVTTMTITAITDSTAVSGGSITANTSTKIAARGVCWSSVNELPTINDSKSSDGSGDGSFTSKLTALKPLRKYYVRAFATDNNSKTYYGAAVSFTTLQ